MKHIKTILICCFTHNPSLAARTDSNHQAHNLCSTLAKRKKKIHFHSILSITCANITSSILELAPEINPKLT